MSPMARSRSLGGRPPLNRSRNVFRFRLENEVVERLHAQAEQAGYRPATYMERVVCLAHGYDSPFLPPPAAPLPVDVEVEELRSMVERLSPEDCGPARSVGSQMAMLRLDEPLGQQVYDWCDEHDAVYGGYVRSILRLAAGVASVDQLRQQHVQDELIDIREGARARAS